MKKELRDELSWLLKISRCDKFQSHWAVVYLIAFLLIFPSFSVYAQSIEITGQVADEGVIPMPGVNVYVKNTSNGTITNFDGNYSLNVSNMDATLVFSYLGYEKKEVPIANQNNIDVILKVDVGQLQEVVLIDDGYGTVRKEDMTGSVATITGKELSNIPVASAAEALTGRLPGVNVSTADGVPGAEINIRIREGSSITQSNAPLFVVDGFIVDGINDIPPTDIQFSKYCTTIGEFCTDCRKPFRFTSTLSFPSII